MRCHPPATAVAALEGALFDWVPQEGEQPAEEGEEEEYNAPYKSPKLHTALFSPSNTWWYIAIPFIGGVVAVVLLVVLC